MATTEGRCVEALDGPSGGVELIETDGVRGWRGPKTKNKWIT